MEKDLSYCLDKKKVKELKPSLNSGDDIYAEIFKIYKKFISELQNPEISTDTEMEGEGSNFLVRAIIDGKIITINTYPHPEKEKMVYIEVGGSDLNGVIKVKNLLENLLLEKK